MPSSTKATDKAASPVGTSHREAMNRRSRSPEYQAELQRLKPFEGIARMVIGRRMSLGLTQQELAERIGTSHSVISRIEGGQYPTTVKTLQRLATGLETSLVLGFDDDAAELGQDVPDARRHLVTVS